eukprot:Unigene11258_Nuclearia_a/m.34395 Unigene11258_Nuclearia_a/g.34395  ORF Unigene11258_Nuclearia_a/g.34395 Unigene11258_Nuclearia_a/m.34395 type:complete len:319 (+) Unigene11258_Nuclearia_a:1279-2235(+)
MHKHRRIAAAVEDQHTEAQLTHLQRIKRQLGIERGVKVRDKIRNGLLFGIVFGPCSMLVEKFADDHERVCLRQRCQVDVDALVPTHDLDSTSTGERCAREERQHEDAVGTKAPRRALCVAHDRQQRNHRLTQVVAQMLELIKDEQHRHLVGGLSVSHEAESVGDERHKGGEREQHRVGQQRGLVRCPHLLVARVEKRDRDHSSDQTRFRADEHAGVTRVYPRRVAAVQIQVNTRAFAQKGSRSHPNEAALLQMMQSLHGERRLAGARQSRRGKIRVMLRAIAGRHLLVRIDVLRKKAKLIVAAPERCSQRAWSGFEHV